MTLLQLLSSSLHEYGFDSSSKPVFIHNMTVAPVDFYTLIFNCLGVPHV